MILAGPTLADPKGVLLRKRTLFSGSAIFHGYLLPSFGFQASSLTSSSNLPLSCTDFHHQFTVYSGGTTTGATCPRITSSSRSAHFAKRAACMLLNAWYARAIIVCSSYCISVLAFLFWLSFHHSVPSSALLADHVLGPVCRITVFRNCVPNYRSSKGYSLSFSAPLF